VWPRVFPPSVFPAFSPRVARAIFHFPGQVERRTIKPQVAGPVGSPSGLA